MAARTLGQINAMANITSQTENQRKEFCYGATLFF